MQTEQLTRQDIAGMSYNELIGIVRETNRPPGGLNSIIRIAQQGFITNKTNVLEIGTSTGFTAIELARFTGANIHAIDINPESLREAKERAAKYGVDKNIVFEQEDATQMSYANKSFDVVFCGNVTSLISNKEKALGEYARILKEGGLLAAIPMYYVKQPSENLVQRVSDAIQVRIKPLAKQYWMDLFSVQPFQAYFAEDYHFDNVEPEKVDNFAKAILSREHLTSLSPEAKTELEERYTAHMHLFRENLAHMGYTILLLRNESEPMDPELFTSHRV